MKYTLDVLGSMPFTPEVKARRVGGSLTMTIPDQVAKVLGIKEGDILQVDVQNGSLFAKKKEATA